ncbi:MAG: hypothetical protein SGPRY_000698 [Prymnesium sp.]
MASLNTDQLPVGGEPQPEVEADPRETKGGLISRMKRGSKKDAFKKEGNEMKHRSTSWLFRSSKKKLRAELAAEDMPTGELTATGEAAPAEEEVPATGEATVEQEALESAETEPEELLPSETVAEVKEAIESKVEEVVGQMPFDPEMEYEVPRAEPEFEPDAMYELVPNDQVATTTDVDTPAPQLESEAQAATVIQSITRGKLSRASTPTSKEALVQEVVPEVVQEAMPEAVQETMPEAEQEVVPEAVQEAISEAVQDAMPEAVQDAMPEAVPEAVKEAVQEAMPEALQESMPEAVPDAEEVESHSASKVKRSYLLNLRKSSSAMMTKLSPRLFSSKSRSHLIEGEVAAPSSTETMPSPDVDYASPGAARSALPESFDAPTIEVEPVDADAKLMSEESMIEANALAKSVAAASIESGIAMASDEQREVALASEQPSSKGCADDIVDRLNENPIGRQLLKLFGVNK